MLKRSERGRGMGKTIQTFERHPRQANEQFRHEIQEEKIARTQTLTMTNPKIHGTQASMP